MPNPMDCSVLLSLWKVEADRTLPEGSNPPLREARKAFAWPYVMTAFLAVCFCIMGAGVMHSSGISPLADAPGFSGQIVGLYREALGPAFAVLAAVAALSVLLTSVIAAMDGYARTFAAAFAVVRGADEHAGGKAGFTLFVVLFVAIASVALFTLLSDLTTFLDFVTSVSFVIAPVIALLNYLVITRCDVPEQARPTTAIKAWTWLGIAVMAGLAAMYFVLVLG
jgi:Mn2+/Fe2+ NRAMP family transporter